MTTTAIRAAKRVREASKAAAELDAYFSRHADLGNYPRQLVRALVDSLALAEASLPLQPKLDDYVTISSAHQGIYP